MGDNSSDLYTSIQKTVGAYFRQKTHRKKKTDKREEKNQKENSRYQSYERYEKYERYERYESRSYFKQDNFDSTQATDFEKAKYYGKVLGLSGKITKSHVRKKYLELIGQYHPDKVFELIRGVKSLIKKPSH